MATPLHFGTDGIRGKATDFPFVAPALFALGKAIAQWGIQKFSKSTITILLVHDTRISCNTIKETLSLGLAQESTQIHDAGVLPTPAVAHLLQTNDIYDFGIIISASHNPYTDNGIKIMNRQGKLDLADEQIITSLFETLFQPLIPHTIPTPQLATTYQEIIQKIFSANFLHGKKIVLDCAQGATFTVAPAIFTHLGATVIPLATTPTGTNINNGCGTLHPQDLQAAVLAHHADVGFAFDGDGDRVIAVAPNGSLKDGDDLLALLLQHPSFTKESTIVGTVMTNYGFEQYIGSINKNLIRTHVGDKYVAAQLEKANALLGGEPSGHIIMRNYVGTGDGILVALKVLESITISGNWAMETFHKIPQVIVNVSIKHKKKLDQSPCAEIIADYNAQLIAGRIIVRYSGTENLLRVMVEDQTLLATQTIAKNLSAALQVALNSDTLIVTPEHPCNSSSNHSLS